MSENIRLTRKQIAFLQEWLEGTPEQVAEKFLELMLLEKVDLADIGFVIDRIIVRIERKKK